jgi:hypothetical protein
MIGPETIAPIRRVFGLHVAAYYIGHKAHIGATTTVLTVAVPLAVYVLTLFALYTFLVRAVDPFHIALLAGTAALLVLPVLLATIGAAMAVCLVVLMLAPLVPRHWLRGGRIQTQGHRSPPHPRTRPASHWIDAVLREPGKRSPRSMVGAGVSDELAAHPLISP